MKIIKILEGEKELKTPTKYGFLRVIVEKSTGEQFEKTMYPEEYKYLMFKNKLLDKGIDENELNEILDLYSKYLNRKEHCLGW